ncbi:MAG: hypothetical protein LLF28_03130 [Nitrospiraceae bacterium]|nr:hypothetical protein [Nitrospiraceae bacterium]
MKKPKKRKKPKPRIPIEGVLKLKTHVVLTKKGKKGYNRKQVKENITKNIDEEVQS